MPHSNENSVDLPAPFGPMMQHSWPAGTSRLTWSVATTPPNLLASPSVANAEPAVIAQRPVNAAAMVARQPWRGRSRANVTTIPRGKNIITTTSSTPMITIAYWFPAEDSE